MEEIIRFLTNPKCSEFALYVTVVFLFGLPFIPVFFNAGEESFEITGMITAASVIFTVETFILRLIVPGLISYEQFSHPVFVLTFVFFVIVDIGLALLFIIPFAIFGYGLAVLSGNVVTSLRHLLSDIFSIKK
ncbi:MAG: hypothetical protein HGA67_03305 [Candidatus Yonathbacteria bacterium]|nr:hypothetical protein [Candidatus Yonathbacteria bacterium]